MSLCCVEWHVCIWQLEHMICQTCYRNGKITALSFCSEFYFSECPELKGQKFATACFAFEGAVCIGICTATPQPLSADSDKTSRIFLNPPGDTCIEAGDKLIFVAEDDDTYTYEKRFVTNFGAPPDVQAPPKQPTRTLCIGWRRDMHEMVFEVDKWVMPGSNLTIMAPGSEDDGYCPPGPSEEETTSLRP